MLYKVVVVFALCWLPGQVLLIWLVSRNRQDWLVQQNSTFLSYPFSQRVIYDAVVHLVVTHHWIQVGLLGNDSI